jgi:choline dehydrogenase
MAFSGCSPASAYLPTEVLNRPNLTIALKTRTTRLLFHSGPNASTKPRCIAVEVAQDAKGPRYQIKVRKEVILCAGAIGTPQLLTCSGIGPEDTLKSLGIAPVAILEHVGQNLSDVSFRACQPLIRVFRLMILSYCLHTEASLCPLYFPSNYIR